ncbi:lytic murein transglycosylase [Nitrosomonas sp.]|uniref:lytic murein transglycosylase n=1 Tax=Nitrosomonas sp. TaxID=42353 RepID=UPI0025E58FEB|nr:lytic murein transglycosylase [Nitrosomonas sp.]
MTKFTEFKILSKAFLLTGLLFFCIFELAANQQFNQCVSDLKTQASQQGISNNTVKQVLDNVKYLARVIELDRRQPEFTQTFAGYFNTRITDERVRNGRKQLNKHRELLEKIYQKTGIPPKYLVSFWGLETNYGGYFGSWSVPDSLATLACDQRRSAYFTQELLNALRIIDAGDITPERMVGSWAGAMGHMQFMPSTFLGYARDADGDGRRDLWGSIEDAMTSAANFLLKMGWNPDFEWGQEVKLPPDFDYSLTGNHQKRSLNDWIAQGVTPVSGPGLLPSDQKAALLVPAGHQGPAFLVTDNFHVIMRWNRSEYYALSVGHLADRIAGESALSQQPPPDDIKITREQVRQLQKDLHTLGIDAGVADGVMGPQTRNAISLYQQKTQRIADGHLDSSLLAAIRAAASGLNN